jgi:DNA-directed RNA polymerase beta' subunit
VDTAVKTAETGYMSRRLMKVRSSMHLYLVSTEKCLLV